MITLNIILFAILCITIVYIVLECIEQYHEEKLAKEFIETAFIITLKEKEKMKNDKCN